MMETESTALEARFDAILPTLATKADLMALEARFARFEAIVPTLATKADLYVLAGRLSALEARFDTIVPTLVSKADILSLKAELHDGIANLYKWMIASMIGMFIGFGGMFMAATNMLKVHAQPPSALVAPSLYPPPSHP